VITGLLDPSDGEVELFGSSAGRLPANQRICLAVKTSASFPAIQLVAGADGRRKRGGPPELQPE